MVTIYGIRNCDTIRKARAWLDARGVAYRFHDYKTAGVPADELTDWIGRLGWEALLNRTGTTFRALPEAERAPLDRDRALAIMCAHPSAIRRPVAVDGDTVLAGFDAAAYDAAFASS